MESYQQLKRVCLQSVEEFRTFLYYYKLPTQNHAILYITNADGLSAAEKKRPNKPLTISGVGATGTQTVVLQARLPTLTCRKLFGLRAVFVCAWECEQSISSYGGKTNNPPPQPVTEYGWVLKSNWRVVIGR